MLTKIKSIIFNQKLIPNIPPERIFGGTDTNFKKKAKEMFKEETYQSFLESLPHHYFEENQILRTLIKRTKKSAFNH